MRKYVYEVLNEFKSVKKHEDRLNILRFNRTYELESVLKGALSPNVHFWITEIPKYKPSDAPPGMGYQTIQNNLKKLYIYEVDSPKRIGPINKQKALNILIETLENMEAREAEVFANMFMKDLRVPKLTYELVKEAWPDW